MRYRHLSTCDEFARFMALPRIASELVRTASASDVTLTPLPSAGTSTATPRTSTAPIIGFVSVSCGPSSSGASVSSPAPYPATPDIARHSFSDAKLERVERAANRRESLRPSMSVPPRWMPPRVELVHSTRRSPNRSGGFTGALHRCDAQARLPDCRRSRRRVGNMTEAG